MAHPATVFYLESDAREELLARLRVSGSLSNFEERLRRKDGSEVWVLETVSLVEGDRGEPEFLEGTLIDISTQKRVEEALRRSEQLHRNIFGFAPIGIYQSRRDGSLITANPKLAGYELIIADEVFRGRFRKSYERPEAIPSNRVQEYRIDLHSAAHRFLKGHRIGVQIQSAWFPLIDRNPQRFVPNIFTAKAADFHAATQRIYRSRRYPTHIILPVR